jgi:Protein of unknown function (DUF3443)
MRVWVRRTSLAILSLMAAWLLTSCGGGGGGDSPTPRNNVLAVTVDGGPGNAVAFNAAFATVTVCVPSTGNCVAVDHVLIDTGSYGLRILAGALNGLALPATTIGSHPLAECGVFASGYTWGSVRSADVKLAGETASNISVQVIGDTGAAYASVPQDCSSSGLDVGTQAALGANGILGVGPGLQDCPECAVSKVPGAYYQCPAAGCINATVPLSQQVANPVGFLPADNNGVVLSLPAVPTSGVSSLTGTLTLGIGTQANNALGSANIYTTDGNFEFTTTLRTTTYSASFIDSGSNGLFFNDSTLTPCSGATGWYCPSLPTSLSAINRGLNGVSGTVNFTIANFDQVVSTPSIVAASVGGGAGGVLGGSTFDWGLPFFFGRTVFTAIEGRSTPAGPGPYWAY